MKIKRGLKVKKNICGQKYVEYKIDDRLCFLYFYKDKIITLSFDDNKFHYGFTYTMQSMKNFLLSLEEAYNSTSKEYHFKKTSCEYVLKTGSKVILNIEERLSSDIFSDRKIEFDSNDAFKEFIITCEKNYNQILEDFPKKPEKHFTFI